jgi:hypothetical protein
LIRSPRLPKQSPDIVEQASESSVIVSKSGSSKYITVTLSWTTYSHGSKQQYCPNLNEISGSLNSIEFSRKKAYFEASFFFDIYSASPQQGKILNPGRHDGALQRTQQPAIVSPLSIGIKLREFGFFRVNIIRLF